MEKQEKVLERLQEAFRRWDERRCNGECTKEEYDTAVEALRERAKRYGFHVRFEVQ